MSTLSAVESAPSVDGSDYEDEENTQSIRQSAFDVLKTKGDTERLRMFRFLVLGMLIMTGIVTGVAFYLLREQEDENFQTAVS